MKFSDFKKQVEDSFTEEFVLNVIFSEVKKKKKEATPNQWRGVCPFPGHSGKDATDFSINIKTTQCKCHGGCGFKGNYISYIKEMKKNEKPINWCAEQLGINKIDINQEITKKEKKYISNEFIEDKHAELLNNQTEPLLELLNMGISIEIIKEYKVGYHEEYFLFPITDKNNKYVNAIKYNPKKKPKSKAFPGIEGFHLYPYKSLESETIYVFEGEKDTLLGLTLGLSAITNIKGVQNWDNDFGKQFKNKNVIICMDIDKAGQEGSQVRVESILPYANSIKNIILPLDSQKHPNGDFWDYIQIENNDISAFIELVKKTPEIKATNILPDNQTNNEIAQYIRRKYKFAYIHNDGFYRYLSEKGIWEVDNEYAVKKLIKSILENNDIKVTYAKLKEISELLKIEVLQDKEFEFNKYKNIIVLKNVVYDTDKHITKDFNEFYYSTIKVPNITYDLNSKCDVWEKCLIDWSCDDEQWILFVQEMFGYCMVPWILHGESFFFHGEGSNGKSLLLNILRQVVGKENTSSVSFKDLNDKFSIINVKDKLVNISTETDSVVVDTTSIFKSVATGDMISARYLYKNIVQFQPFCKMLFAVNEFPTIRDRTDGFYRRLCIIPFEKHFDMNQADINLEKKLKNELNGIFQWSLEGLKRLSQNNKFTECNRINLEKNKYITRSSTLRSFVEEECLLCESIENKIEKKEFRKRYVEWCKENGYGILNDRNVGIELNKIGVRGEGPGTRLRETGLLKRYYLKIRFLNEIQENLYSKQNVSWMD